MSQIFVPAQAEVLFTKEMEEDIPAPSTSAEEEELPEAPFNDLCWRSAEEVARSLSIGDLIEFQRVEDKRYMHWAVYIGIFNGGIQSVVHYSPGSGGDFDAKAGNGTGGAACGEAEFTIVRIYPFFETAGQSLCRVNNTADNKRVPFPPEKIKERALSKVGSKGYSMFFNNCEHFAKWCRNDCLESDQATFYSRVMAQLGRWSQSLYWRVVYW